MKLKNNLNKEIQKCKAEYYSNLISENKSNPSALWKTLNEISSIEADGVAHYDNPSIAKIRNVHFSTIGTKLAMTLKSFISLPSPPAKNHFCDVITSVLYISARPLKDSASVISKSLTKLFNKFFGHSYLPFLMEIWKGIYPLQKRRSL